MPSREDIAQYLIRITYILPEHSKQSSLSLAAQVKNMRCEACVWYDMPYGWCNRFDLAIDKDFGCFSHEQKPAD